MKEAFVELGAGQRKTRIATLHRTAEKTAVVFLHGFGSTKEDYADALALPAFEGREILLFDFPGCGGSQAPDGADFSIKALIEITGALLDKLDISRCHLVGHSMGGLTALFLAARFPDRLASFTNIEGNLGPEDCFLSRQVRDYPSHDAAEFLAGLAERIKGGAGAGFPVYGAALASKIQAGPAVDYLGSILRHSEADPLLEIFMGLAMPRQFIFGSENAGLTYLERLRQSEVRVTEIPRSNHFPMYTNPSGMFEAIAGFIESVETRTSPA
ncbi:MAG: alpha/beta hydrolase [Sphingomonadales bacterium]